ncbi:AAA family ATPase [Rhizobium leguminosarum]|uniref:AAA family ATPase n=1 Tax=Rhizobium leguminosarum TaxID=384 RepID=UPI003CFE1080
MRNRIPAAVARRSLPNVIAFCAIRNALRHILDVEGVSFVAALIVPRPEDFSVYAVTINALCRGDGEPWASPGHGTDIILVEHETDCSKLDDRLDELYRHPRVILLLASDKFVNERVQIASDVVAHLPAPTVGHVKGAVRRFTGEAPSDMEAKFILSQRWECLRDAFRPGRGLGRSLSILRRLPIEPVRVSDAGPQSPPSSLPASDGPGLHDLHGYGAAKEWGFELARDFADFRAGKIDWRDLDCGALLSGPPGTGKTIFARALAKTCSVPLILGSGARWQAGTHLGDMLKQMRKCFADAAKAAPSILFIDEMDSFGNRDKDDSGSTYWIQVVNALLECMDGADRGQGVVVVGACNNASRIDPAILRPGRLDRHFQITLPDAVARLQIMQWHLGTAMDFDVRNFTRRSEGMTGAQIEKVAKEARRRARRANRAIAGEDIEASLPRRMPISKEYQWAIAVHEAGHAIVGSILGSEPLSSLAIEDSISPDTDVQALGGASFEIEPARRQTRSYYLGHIATLLGGIAAELVVFGDFADGAGSSIHSDLQLATRCATMVEGPLAMGSSWLSDGDTSLRSLSEARYRNPLLEHRVEALLAQQMKVAVEALRQRENEVRALAAALMERKQLSGDEVRAMICSS